MGNNCCNQPLKPLEAYLGVKRTKKQLLKDSKGYLEDMIGQQTNNTQKKGLTTHTRKGTQINRDIFFYRSSDEESDYSKSHHCSNISQLMFNSQSNMLMDNFDHFIQQSPRAHELQIMVPQIVEFTLNSLGDLNIPKHLLHEFEGFPFLPPKKLKDGNIYWGQWYNGKRHGLGKQYFLNGAVYEGIWKNDKSELYGRLVHADGDAYVGQWYNDMADGFGTYYYANGAYYKGQWKNDKQNGFGHESWPDESVFEGYYKDGKKIGKGKMIWKNGSHFEGEFKNNVIEGYGEYQWQDGKIYRGHWKNNQLDGNGEFWYGDGRYYKGQFKADKKHGNGMLVMPNGEIQQGVWDNGKFSKIY